MQTIIHSPTSNILCIRYHANEGMKTPSQHIQTRVSKMRYTKTTAITLAVVAIALFVALAIAFADDFFTGTFWTSDSITGGTWLSWAMLGAIIVAGFKSIESMGDKSFDLRPERATGAIGQVDDPALWKIITGNTHFAILWLPVRFFLAKEWLSAGEGKLRNGWLDSGDSLLGFWKGAVAVPDPESGKKAAITYDWYRDFLQFMIDHNWAPWFSKLVACGEFLVGLGLLVGALVGIAAFFGTLLNMSFMLAGTTSTNPALFGMTVFLILAWKIAGYWGLDRWLLNWLGTPWDRRPAETQAS